MKSKRSRLAPAKNTMQADAQQLALDCMLAAMGHLDSDDRISPVVGAQLQLAIDRLNILVPAEACAS